MFVITENLGFIVKKLLANSHASEIIIFDFPVWALEFNLGRVPPMTHVGSVFASNKIVLIMLVVVVFPWVPETAIEFSKVLNINPSNSRRSRVFILFSRAYFNSGLLLLIAAEYIIKS